MGIEFVGYFRSLCEEMYGIGCILWDTMTKEPLPDDGNPESDKTPVLLIHGFNSSPSIFRVM